MSASLPSPYLIGAPDEVTQFGLSAFAVGGWATSNKAFYYPLRLPSTQRIAAVSFYCGTAASGTFDLALYDATLTTKLASTGSTSLVNSTKHSLTLATPMLLEASKRLYIGLACSTTSVTVLRQAPSVLNCRSGGAAEQATAHPLPANPTPAQIASTFWVTFAVDLVI